MTTDTVGGVWNYSLELSRALARDCVAVSLAAIGRAPDERQRAEARTLPNLELLESNYRLEWMEDPWDDLRRAGDWLLELEARLDPDLIHLNGYVHAALDWSAPTVVVGHSCVLSWWRAVIGTDAPEHWHRYRNAVAMGLRSANAVVAPSWAMLSALYRHYGPMPAGRVIHNGRDAHAFAPGAKEEMVLAVGRLWDKAKNITALEQIAAALQWPIYVAGEQQHPDGNRAQFCRLHPLGRLDTRALSRWYARAAIYALPARYEPFGLSVVEAALSGCALVLGDIPSLRELWDEAALFVVPDDYERLRETIETLIANPVLRATLSKRAQVRAAEYSPERMAQNYLQLYGDLMSTRRTMATRALGTSLGSGSVVSDVEDPVC